MTAEVPANPVGRLTRVVDWAGEQLFNYDARGRSVYERRVMGVDQYNIRRSYDSMDREITTTYPATTSR